VNVQDLGSAHIPARVSRIRLERFPAVWAHPSFRSRHQRRSLDKGAPFSRLVQRIGYVTWHRCSAAFITIIAESSFRYTQGRPTACRAAAVQIRTVILWVMLATIYSNSESVSAQFEPSLRRIDADIENRDSETRSRISPGAAQNAESRHNRRTTE
jgi:hypothetical protein